MIRSSDGGMQLEFDRVASLDKESEVEAVVGRGWRNLHLDLKGKYGACPSLPSTIHHLNHCREICAYLICFW
jgi:hypothetical protein